MIIVIPKSVDEPCGSFICNGPSRAPAPTDLEMGNLQHLIRQPTADTFSSRRRHEWDGSFLSFLVDRRVWGLPSVVRGKRFWTVGDAAPTNLNYFVEITDKNIQGRYNLFVREEKKDNTDENRCELLTSPAHAPRLTDFYKSTILKLRSI